MFVKYINCKKIVIGNCFASEGSKVIIADIQEEAGKAIANTLTDSLFLKVDVSFPSEAEAMIETSVAHYGKLDVLVNNAGIIGQQAPTAESSIG